MFDDRLFDVIMGEMMEAFGSDVRTDEGSLAYNACCKIADKLEEVYGDMSEINDNLLVDTMDLNHLISYAKERGLEYQYATFPIVRGEFQQAIEIGERFACNDFTYEVTEQIDGFNYKLTCETDGTEANANLGELAPIDYIDEYLGGNITEVIVAGVDDMEEEDFRNLVIQSFKAVAFGGNRSDYRHFVNSLAGVGGSKPVRRAVDSPFVNVYIVTTENKSPSSELVNAVQTAVDPELNHGAGDGIAPICHSVQIIGAEAVSVNVSTSITFDTGYSASTSQNDIDEVVKGYIEELSASWEAHDLEDLIVRISQIEAKILSVEGVLDVTDTKINESASNLILDYRKIPTFGGVSIV